MKLTAVTVLLAIFSIVLTFCAIHKARELPKIAEETFNKLNKMREESLKEINTEIEKRRIQLFTDIEVQSQESQKLLLESLEKSTPVVEEQVYQPKSAPSCWPKEEGTATVSEGVLTEAAGKDLNYGKSAEGLILGDLENYPDFFIPEDSGIHNAGIGDLCAPMDLVVPTGIKIAKGKIIITHKLMGVK